MKSLVLTIGILFMFLTGCSSSSSYGVADYGDDPEAEAQVDAQIEAEQEAYEEYIDEQYEAQVEVDSDAMQEAMTEEFEEDDDAQYQAYLDELESQEEANQAYQEQFQEESECNIKGNVNYNSGEKIYHLPGDPYYNGTVINEEYGEQWFCSPEDAEAAGYRRSY